MLRYSAKISNTIKKYLYSSFEAVEWRSRKWKRKGKEGMELLYDQVSFQQYHINITREYQSVWYREHPARKDLNTLLQSKALPSTFQSYQTQKYHPQEI